jgi:alpha-tubulin suppressor-like RCC1 family protein
MNHTTPNWQNYFFLLALVIMFFVIFIAGCLTQNESSNRSIGKNNAIITTMTENPQIPKLIAISDGGIHAIALNDDETVKNIWCTNDREFICVVPKNLTGVTSISVGDEYSLALKKDGTIVFWGKPYWSNQIPSLTNVTEVFNVMAISAGVSHALALKKDGTVIAKGSSLVGALDVPENLTNVTSISAGGEHSLALKDDGTVVGWGARKRGTYFGYGQADVPSDLIGVIAISAGLDHSLALKKDGSIVAWGDNRYGQCDIPPHLSDVSAISAGYFHSLALKNDGTVVAWGDNETGQCNVPANLTDVIAISAGKINNFALKKDGTIVSWGKMKL